MSLLKDGKRSDRLNFVKKTHDGAKKKKYSISLYGFIAMDRRV